MKQWWIVFQILILLVFSSLANAQSSIRITNGEWAPYLSENLPHYGSGSKIITEAFRAVGVDVEYGFFPWARSYELAKEGIWAATAVWSHSDERAQVFHFSDPVFNYDETLFALKGRNIDWQDINDLRNYTVGATRGYYYGPEFEEAEKSGLINVERVSFDELNMRKLLRGRIDLVAINEDVGKTMIRTKFSLIEANAIEVLDKPLHPRSSHLLISKKDPLGLKYTDLFNRGLKIIKENGVYNEIINSDEYQGQ